MTNDIFKLVGMLGTELLAGVCKMNLEIHTISNTHGRIRTYNNNNKTHHGIVVEVPVKLTSIQKLFKETIWSHLL